MNVYYYFYFIYYAYIFLFLSNIKDNKRENIMEFKITVIGIFQTQEIFTIIF